VDEKKTPIAGVFFCLFLGKRNNIFSQPYFLQGTARLGFDGKGILGLATTNCANDFSCRASFQLTPASCIIFKHARRSCSIVGEV
jgi:hypothetical protein